MMYSHLSVKNAKPIQERYQMRDGKLIGADGWLFLAEKGGP
jgi:hypothetical protein